ncbi:hypothetical protein ACO0RG_000445 [Hanseniaspora osmophila]|uniref:Uncharacterized protein n=1 Tax=Hanseniaspora osmophila TaxID=56408 RepID=A0A1E5R1H0_9ASCO|nr:hypothetical protein AWRI3579_g4320 [Hanseniaspora osmophila]
MGLKDTFLKVKRWFSGEPIPGETYKQAPDVKDLPHIVDSSGALVAVSSGKRELSPVLSQKLNIQKSPKVSQIDDQI